MNRNITATILIIIAVGIYFTVTKSVIADAQAVKKVNDEYVSALNNAEKLKSELAKITERYQQVPEKERQSLDLMIPSTVDNIRLIIDLTSLAMQNGLTLSDVRADVPSKTNAQSFGSQANRGPAVPAVPAITGLPADVSVSPQVVASEPVLDKVIVSFKTNTTYERFKAFLEAVESNIRIMNVSRIATKAVEGNTLDFEVEIETYWLRQ